MRRRLGIVRKTRFAWAMQACRFLSRILALFTATVALAADATNEVSAFVDPALESAVRQQVFAKRGTLKPITAADVANISTVQGNLRGITNLAGLEHCKALASLDLAGNRIVDLSPLTGLRQLQYLNLQSNHVADVKPLSTIPALQYIELSANRVSDAAPLAACTNLASLYLSNDQLTSLNGLTAFPRLVSLYLDGNRLTTIAGLENLRSLSSVSLSRNQISDLAPLAGLRAPSFFLLENNRIKDLSPLVKSCTADAQGPNNFAPFLNLYLKGNPLDKTGRQQLEELKKLGVRVNP
ncbi:MAG: leucine-rich repeat domain-containing protein [Pedosphaera sp.]|nr:leucine-rich repeat domain-containing protein [Pedosphaera sp.]